jgi:hypothetical protein
MSEDMYERITNLFGSINIWRGPLLSIMNKTFHTNARSLIYIYE